MKCLQFDIIQGEKTRTHKRKIVGILLFFDINKKQTP